METINECSVCGATCQPSERWAYYLSRDGESERALHNACAEKSLMRDEGMAGAMFRKWSVEPIGVEKPAAPKAETEA